MPKTFLAFLISSTVASFMSFSGYSNPSCFHLYHPHRRDPGRGDLVLDHAAGGFVGRDRKGSPESAGGPLVRYGAVRLCALRDYPVPGGPVLEGGLLNFAVFKTGSKPL